MSKPIRYSIADNRVQRLYGGDCLVVDPNGPLVEWTDYARLKAEVERLTNCKAEADRLKAEVERLRKAGDALYELALPYRREYYPEGEAWYWAKKGEQP